MDYNLIQHTDPSLLTIKDFELMTKLRSEGKFNKIVWAEGGQLYLGDFYNQYSKKEFISTPNFRKMLKEIECQNN